MSIRARIWCTLLLAVVLPVGGCLYLLSRTSYDHSIEQAKAIYNERSESTSRSLDSFLNVRLSRDVDNLLRTGNFGMMVGARRNQNKFWQEAEPQREAVSEAWQARHAQTLSNPHHPRMRWFYYSMPASWFNHHKKSFPELKDFLLVDENGLPLGGTEKPQGFDQSQEEWLMSLRSLNDRNMLVRWEEAGLHSGPRRLEVLVTVRDRLGSPTEGDAGAYLKLSVEFTPLFNEFLHATKRDRFDIAITDGKGQVLAALGVFSPIPIDSELPASWMAQDDTHAGAASNMLVSDKIPGTPLLVSRSSPNDLNADNMLGLRAFSGATMNQIVGPLRKAQWQLFGGTFIVIALGVAASSIYMRKTISRPIEQIAAVSDEILNHSRQGGVLDEAEVAQLVAPLRKVNTKDEIGMLAEHFSKMSMKTLGYQRRLEHEVAQKTHLIQSDLEMAREFQQALLPTGCQCCSSQLIHDPLELHFAHIYQPAGYVSGDFYDYLRVDDHKVAVLIGDVMGHGARSALVTAILHTLIEEVALLHKEPAAFLTALNHRYHEIIQRSGQMVFVSACYLLFDTETGLVTGASAGHPTPLRANLNGSGVTHLFPMPKPRLPLGMVSHVVYQSVSAKLSANDLILLYTDGVTEAESDEGEQFGEDALSKQVASHVARQPLDLVNDVAELVRIHSCGSASDDVCMVAIRVLRAAA